MPTPAEPQVPSGAVSLHDSRPFFEKALVHGVQAGILEAEHLATIRADAPKGIVQIARYFGTEFLRPELEQARARMVNLVSLYLQDSSQGDLDAAARSLRDHSFLSRSKGGSDMLKRLIAMPESSHFSMRGLADAETPMLALWSLRSYADYQAELARRNQSAQLLEAALWFAQPFDLDADALEEAGADAEAVIRAGLLLRALAPRLGAWPSVAAFETVVLRCRKGATPPAAPALPAQLPDALRATVETVRESMRADLPRLLSADQPLRPVLRGTSAFRARYFLVDDPLGDVDAYHRSLDDEAPSAPGSKMWSKLTEGQDDEASLLTLLLCVAAGAPRKTLLTEKSAASLIRRIRKHGMEPDLAVQFVRTHAPEAFQDSYCQMWGSFVHESQATLRSDMDYALHDALALLRSECNVEA